MAQLCAAGWTAHGTQINEASIWTRAGNTNSDTWVRAGTLVGSLFGDEPLGRLSESPAARSHSQGRKEVANTAVGKDPSHHGDKAPKRFNKISHLEHAQWQSMHMFLN